MKLRLFMISLGSLAFRLRLIYSYSNRFYSKLITNRNIQNNQCDKNVQLNCVGTELTPLNKDAAPFPTDTGNSDQSWKSTINPNIVAVRREPFTTRPELITFDYSTLITPSQSIGRWYREALNTACDMKVRLPRPALFTAAFFKAYNKRNVEHPCFGALSGLTPEQWWFEVVKQTFLNTEKLTALDPEEINQIMPKVFKNLFYDIFSTRHGWTVKEDVLYTLDKLRDWRDQGAGPKIGVIGNNDNRLKAVLSDMGLSQYFDFVLTSYDLKTAMPDRAVFDLAIQKIKAQNPASCYHIGEMIETDVQGAVNAGWTAIRINENFDHDFPDWFAVDTEEQAAQGAERRMDLMNWGRKDVEKNIEWVEIWGLDDILQLFGFPEDETKPISTTYVRNFFDDE